MAVVFRIVLVAVMASSVICFDLVSLDPKVLLKKVRDTLEMAVGMLWVTGASMKCSKSLKTLVRDAFGGEIWALYGESQTVHIF